MRKFLKIFLRSLGTYLGLDGVLTRPSFIVGFPQLVILITYGMRYFAMDAVSLVCILAKKLTSVPMWCCCDVHMKNIHVAAGLIWEAEKNSDHILVVA